MKKLFSLVLFSVMLSSASANAQVVANDDIVYANVASQGLIWNGSYYNNFNVLANDSVDSSYAYNEVTITVLSSSDPGLSLSNGYLYIDSATPVGVQTMTYQICRMFTSECDTATLTINLCDQPAPTATVVQPDCSSPNGSITLTGLPAGNWTIQKQISFSNWTSYPGSGSSYTFNNLPPNSYSFRVINDSGCMSPNLSANINYPNGMNVTPVGVYQDANNNGITDAGDIVNWHLDITNSFNCAITNVDTLYTSIDFVGAPIASIAGNSTDSSITGVQVLTQDDINNGQATVAAWMSADSPAGQQYGKYFGTLSLNLADRIRFDAFIDTNGNGIQDNGEQNFSSYDANFQWERNNDGVVHNVESGTGTLTIYENNPSNSYNVSFNMYTDCSQSYTVAPSSYANVTIPAGSGLTVYPIAITVVPCTDLSVYVERRETARPGQTYSHWISYSNNGNQPVSGLMTFTCDPAVTVLGTSNPGAIVTSGGFTFDVGTLQPGDWDYFYVTMQTPPSPTVSLGDLLTSNVSITIPAGDSDVANNISSITEDVTNSYDPNDISESHGPRIVWGTFTADDYLRYIIRFENTGNADALNIRVENILDDKLDPESVRMIASSHSYVLDRVGNDLQWQFSDIMLPPSDVAGDDGKGFVVFEVKPKPGYAIGDIIPATASIFFDTNPAIVTNTFNTEFVATLGAPQFSVNDVRVYPNPAKSIVNFSLDPDMIEQIAITDVSGKLVLKEMPHSMSASMNISSLAKGLYFAKITSSDKEKIVKIIKE
ncbi:MAG: T9SS type A sorting domain-containing protein [Flavobacterium sp.]|nr:MAG: T9SS type A sorting domain-containing protein [Flavobacterium sp.]